MTPLEVTTATMLAGATGTLIGWLLAKMHHLRETARRDARELIAEARRGTDLFTNVSPWPHHHWSDICRRPGCHHERQFHAGENRCAVNRCRCHRFLQAL